NSGGIPEAVREGENGLLADPTDPTDIAAKVARLLDDPALASRMGDAGRRLATEHFTFARMVGTLVEAVGA
ncbi:glycosyltransferase, partial [bacterium]|nr:glycosyltransferase [bacterium]